MSVLNLDKVDKVMVFGAHPDDEIIGPGGIIHQLSQQGKEVYVVTFTGGESAANSPEKMEEMLEARQKEMTLADKILGVSKREFLQIPSQQVYAAVYGNLKVTCPRTISKDGEITLHHMLIHLIRKYQPQILFTHAPDNHRDHAGIADITPQAVSQASSSILKHLGNPWEVPLLLYYCVVGDMVGKYAPNIAVEIEKDDLEAKLKAMRTQVSQTRGHYLDRIGEIMTGRAKLWGAKLFGAGRYAEIFHLDDSVPLRIRLSSE